MLSSFPLLFFEGWSVVEGRVDAKLSFGMLMAATAAAPPRIILRRDRQADPLSELGDIADSAAFFGVGMFIAIYSLALGSEVEGLQIALLAFLEETNSDITTGFAFIRKNELNLYDRDGHGIVSAYRKSFGEIVGRPAHSDQPAPHDTDCSYIEIVFHILLDCVHYACFSRAPCRPEAAVNKTKTMSLAAYAT
jgi:hypothetical protein